MNIRIFLLSLFAVLFAVETLASVEVPPEDQQRVTIVAQFEEVASPLDHIVYYSKVFTPCIPKTAFVLHEKLLFKQRLRHLQHKIQTILNLQRVPFDLSVHSILPIPSCPSVPSELSFLSDSSDLSPPLYSNEGLCSKS